MKLIFKDNSNQFKAKEFKILAKKVFNKLGFNDKIEIGLEFTDNIKIKELNKKYLGIDKPTDVLSFPIDNPKKDKNNKDNKELLLGDIVISTEMAEKYSRDNNKNLKEEIAQLFQHGLLHLLGYDHQKNKSEWQKAELKIKT